MLKKPTLKAAAIAAMTLGAYLPSTGFAGVEATSKEIKETQPSEPRFKLYGWIEGGITKNFSDPADNQNFGRLFDDREAEPLLNQAVITAERALDPKATGFDWAFKA